MIAQLWHAPLYPAQGLVRFIDDDLELLFHYMQNVNSDSPRWWVGASITGVFNLWTTEGTDEIPAGVASVREDGQHLIYNANTPEHGRFSQKLELLAQSDHPLNGPWMFPGETTQGFTVVILPDAVVMHWFGQRPPPRYGEANWNSVENQTQDWSIWSGIRNGESAFMGENIIKHSRFMQAGDLKEFKRDEPRVYDPDDPRVQELPTGSMEFLTIGEGLNFGGIQLEAIA